MSELTRISVDALGGDDAPRVVLEGVELALAEDPSLEVVLCGPSEVIEPFAAIHERCVAQPCTQVIEMGDHPAQAVRSKKDSSLVVGHRLVKEGQVQGFFSAGSTGACLTAATLILGRIKGVSRPAMPVVLPGLKPLVLCDVGANADCKPQYLVQFGVMATIYSQYVLGVADPKAALLNIGSEEAKGSQFAQECHQLLKEQLPNFVGNCEGNDLLAGTFDVAITDGFTGNVALKSIEGTAKTLVGLLKTSLTSSLKNKIGALLAKDALRQVKNALDPDAVGGAPILGVKGVSVVGHGSSNAEAIKNGIFATKQIIDLGMTDVIAQRIAALKAAEQPAEKTEE